MSSAVPVISTKGPSSISSLARILPSRTNSTSEGIGILYLGVLMVESLPRMSELAIASSDLPSGVGEEAANARTGL